MSYDLEQNKIHYGLLQKIQLLKGQVLNGREKIKGIDGNGLEADEIIPEKHILHDLIRGIYKPKNFQCMLSYQATEKEKNYGQQIIWHDSSKNEFDKIILKPPSGEKDNRKKSDIMAAEFAMNNKIPIGIFVNLDAGVNKCLGLGIIRERSVEGDFIVYPTEMEFNIEKRSVNYYTFRTNDVDLVGKLLDENVEKFVFGGISNYQNDLKSGDIVFFVLGGDKPYWDLGLRGICTISKEAYDKGYDSLKPKNFKVELKKEIIFSKSISRTDMVPYRDTYNMIFIGPMLKGEPNQANVKADINQVVSVIKALIDYFPEYEHKLLNIFGVDIFNRAKLVNNILALKETEIEKKEVKLIKNYNIDEVIERINLFMKKNSFILEKDMLNNYFLSLKTKPFLILAGISGTGKSKLIRLFANAIGATTEDGQYNIISVKPDWNDSTELFGYKNINDEFIPGKLTNIIKLASSPENTDKPYFICLDEMNLARIEYYLSEYLSIIESRKFKNGEIVTEELFHNNYLTSESEYSGLKIPQNIYIIGTVNMDDTTFAFSRKVLDRANTIEFSDVDLDTLDFEEGECEPIPIDNNFLKSSFLNIKEALDYDKEFVKETNDKVKAINEILKKGNKNFGYRVRDEIVFYMLENKIAGLLDEDIAFDYQIMQKILPTISGSDEYIKDILIKLFNYCIIDEVISTTGDYVKACEKVAPDKIKYKKSAKKILMMLRGYEDGFTSFWV